MGRGVLFAEFLEFVLVEADGGVGGAIVDVAVVLILAETAREAAHSTSSSEIIIKLKNILTIAHPQPTANTTLTHSSHFNITYLIYLLSHARFQVDANIIKKRQWISLLYTLPTLIFRGVKVSVKYNS